MNRARRTVPKCQALLSDLFVATPSQPPVPACHEDHEDPSLTGGKAHSEVWLCTRQAPSSQAAASVGAAGLAAPLDTPLDAPLHAPLHATPPSTPFSLAFPAGRDTQRRCPAAAATTTTTSSSEPRRAPTTSDELRDELRAPGAATPERARRMATEEEMLAEVETQADEGTGGAGAAGETRNPSACRR
jgi:hypothetical protein